MRWRERRRGCSVNSREMGSNIKHLSFAARSVLRRGFTDSIEAGGGFVCPRAKAKARAAACSSALAHLRRHGLTGCRAHGPLLRAQSARARAAAFRERPRWHRTHHGARPGACVGSNNATFSLNFSSGLSASVAALDLGAARLHTIQQASHKDRG